VRTRRDSQSTGRCTFWCKTIVRTLAHTFSLSTSMPSHWAYSSISASTHHHHQLLAPETLGLQTLQGLIELRTQGVTGGIAFIGSPTLLGGFVVLVNLLLQNDLPIGGLHLCWPSVAESSSRWSQLFPEPFDFLMGQLSLEHPMLATVPIVRC
jgi:hypothetical protein